MLHSIECDRAVSGSGALQAYENHVLHKVYEEYGNCAGDVGMLRLSVMGVNRVITTTPQAFADVLRKTGFLRKPPGSYSVFYMFVRLLPLPQCPCSMHACCTVPCRSSRERLETPQP